MKHLFKSEKCNCYTLNKKCPVCGNTTINPRPAKFSIEDKFGGYRRKAKKALLKEGAV